MQNKKYNLIFIGTPEFSVPTLQALISDERFSVSVVITAPDAKVGRKQILTPPPVKVEAKKHNIPILQPSDIKSLPLALREKGLGVRVDVILTIAYGQILPPKILQIPQHGCLNLHASLLPKYRGASPIQTAIANGDNETGVTLMKMAKGMDTGDIIAQEFLQIMPNETGESLHDKLSKLSTEVALKYIYDYIEDKLKLKKQNDAKATYAPKLTREHGKIDWNKSAEEIERLIRAYTPWPGTYTHLRQACLPARQGYGGQAEWNKKILKIISVANIVKINKNKPGTIFLHNDQLTVQCDKDALTIKQLQLAGKKIMSSKEFLAGHSDVIKTRLLP